MYLPFCPLFFLPSEVQGSALVSIGTMKRVERFTEQLREPKAHFTDAVLKYPLSALQSTCLYDNNIANFKISIKRVMGIYNSYFSLKYIQYYSVFILPYSSSA